VNRACPNCHAPRLEPIYEVRGVPTHSCLLMPDRERALGYPTGDVVLGFCPACGFACNTVFDPGMNAYSTSYEEVQTFSPTFNAFASSLVDHLVEERGIRDKDVVEIGCGKGEFLLELCERGGNRGVGIDPSYVPGRGNIDPRGRVRFLNELYAADLHGGIPADLVVCRHTLEHIAPTSEFVATVRRTLGDRPGTLVFFELPDQERVYEERAFWDVYYEHCSYFTAGALERVFLANGFEVLDSRKGFGGQYLLIEARPLAEGEHARFRVSEDLDAIGRSARAFAEAAPEAIAAWQKRFRAWADGGRRVAIWGAGSKGVAFLATLGLTDEISCVVDVNPAKQGTFMLGSGHEIVAPERLRAIRPDQVIVMNPIYVDEIGGMLRDLDVAATVVAL
jgi:SAM-dependent methyltransferase